MRTLVDTLQRTPRGGSVEDLILAAHSVWCQQAKLLVEVGKADTGCHDRWGRTPLQVPPWQPSSADIMHKALLNCKSIVLQACMASLCTIAELSSDTTGCQRLSKEAMCVQEARRVRAAPVVDFLQPLTPAPLHRAGSRDSQSGGDNRSSGNGGSQTTSASRLSQQG